MAKTAYILYYTTDTIFWVIGPLRRPLPSHCPFLSKVEVLEMLLTTTTFGVYIYGQLADETTGTLER